MIAFAKRLRKYLLSFVGVFIAALGFIASKLFDWPIIDRIRTYTERISDSHKLDEFFFFWGPIMLTFFFLNAFYGFRNQKRIEKERLYNSMSYASNHILRNLLNQMQIVRIEAENTKGFDKNSLHMFDQSIAEAENLLSKLSKIETINETNIYKSIEISVEKSSPDETN